MNARNILTRMQDVFFSIMNNWKEASNAMSLMEKSADTLQNSYDKYLETTTAHLQTFKSAFAQLGADTFQTGFLNGIIDFGTALVNIADGVMKVINAVGGLKTVLIGMAGIVATIKADAILAFVTSLPGKIAKLASPIMSLITIISRIPAVYQSMTSGTAVAVQGTSRLTAALQGLGITASAAQLAIGALFAALTIGMMVYSKWKQHQEELRQQAIESAKNAYTESTEVYGLTNEYLELSDAISTNAGARADLAASQDSLIDKLGIEKTRLQELVAEYGNYSDAIRQAAVEKLQEDERDLRGGQNQRATDLVKGATSWWEGGFMSVSASNKVGMFKGPDKSHYDLYKGLKALEDAGFISPGTYSTYSDSKGNKYSQGFALSIATEQDLSTVEGVVAAYKELGQMLDVVGNTIGQDNSLYTALFNKYSGMTDQVKEYSESNAALNENLAEQYVLMSQSDKLAAQNGMGGLVDVNNPENLAGYVTYRNALIDAAVASGEFAGSQDEVANAIDSVLAQSSGLSQFAAEYAEAQNIFGNNDELIEWYGSLSDADKSIVYSIALSTDTAEYQLQDWQDALSSYEIPEEDKISFSDLFTSDDDGSFKKTVDDYVSQMETLNSAKEKLADGSWTSKDFKDLVEAFPELATHADDLEPAIDAVMDSLTGVGSEAGEATGIMAVFENALAMCATDEDRAALEAYRDAILGIAQASEDSETTLEKMSKASTTLTKGISEMQSAISGQQNGKSIDVETFNSDALKDYRGALEMVNGTMQLNADKCKEIAKAKAEEQIAINNTNKAIEQSKYLENARQIEQYRQQLRDANFAQGETAESVQASINALVAENSAIAEACSQYDLLSASIREAIGEYQNWLNAQSSSDYGDMANDTVDAINKIRNTFTEGTDDFGNFGSRKFEAALDFIVPDSVDSTDLAAVESYMNDFKKYLTFDDKGNSTGLNIDQFLQDSVSKGLMSYSDDDGFQILGEQKMEDFAEGLGLSMGVVQAMFDELQLKGAKFDWTDEAVKTVGDLAVEAGEAAEALRGMEGNEDLKIKMDVSDLSTAEEQISALDETIAEMESVKAKPGVDASEIDNANAVIQYCLTQKQLLSQPDVMRVDTSQVEGDISNAISLLQQFQAAQNELEMQAAVGADTSEAEANVQALAGEIAALPADTKLALSIDTTSVESIQSSIDGLTAEMMVTAGIDDTAITGYNPETKECSVIYNPETSLLPESFDTIDRSVNYVALTGNLPSSFPTITRYVNYVKTGDVSVNGTAHAGGTARAGGDWGNAPGGETLVGELGREIVVDPRTGKWYTVGDKGAEFRDIPAGAIVFNHRQTEDLLAHGYVAGRASALVNGTAMVTGGYKPYKPSSGGGSNNSGGSSGGGSNYTPTSYSAPTTNNTSNNKHDTDDKDTEIIDWIEIAIDRIERAIKNAAVIADSAFQKLSKRLSSINDEISLTNDKIAMEQDAYNRYIKEANSVGLSSDLANKVKNGTIDITEYNKDTADKIKDYQKWYELALDCRDAIIELTDSLGELYQSKFNEVQKDYENQLSLLEHMTNAFNNSMDDIEARGYLATTKLYEAQQKVQQDSLVVLNKELQALTDRMSEGVNSGSIAEGSEAWYEMQQAINDVKEKIQETETEIINLGNSIREVNWSHFDYLQERISDVGEEAQFLIDLLGHSELFTDRGQLTDEGMATMGLYAEKYNIYMAQADKYAAEIQKLTRDIANDPNNTKLLERRQELIEAQRDAILAAEGEKDAIVDLVKDGIDRELSALKELIDTYNESLDSAKNLYDYQKKVKKQTKEIADLQKQLAAYANDTSDETRAKVQKLEVDLSSAIETLEETQYDRYISEQKKLLDDLYSEYEQVLNTRLDDVDALISDMIDTVNTNSGSISDTITTAAADVGYTLSKETRDIWANEGLAFSVVSKYGESITGGITSVKAVLDGIAANVASMIKKSDDTAKKTTDTTKPSTPTNDTGKKTTSTPTPTPTPKKEDTKFNDDVKRGIAAAIWIYGSRSGWGNDPERRQKLTAKFGATNAAAVQSYINAHANNGDLYKYWVSTGKSNLSKYYYSAFKTGGLADFTGPAWLDGTPSDPEIVLNADDSKNFMALKDAMREVANGTSPLSALFGGGHDSDIMDGLSKIAAIDTDTSGGIGDVTYNINIPIDHVEDYEDFMNHMRRDRQFEQLIQSMTVDRLVGGSKIAKNKFKW